MRLKTIVVLTILMLFGTSAQGMQENTEWVKFTSPEGTFSLLLPHEPKLEVVSDPDTEQVHNRFNEFEDGYGFIIEYFEDVPTTEVEPYLNGFRGGFVKALKGTLLKENKISLNGYPGRELEVDMTTPNGKKFFCTLRLYVVGTHLYSLVYLRLQEKNAELVEVGDKYFSSFKIIRDEYRRSLNHDALLSFKLASGR